MEFEREELAQIYVGRGVDLELARQVAFQLMEKDALGTHAREELGITDAMSARPIQAACASAAAFSVGAVVPLAAAMAAPLTSLIAFVATVSLLLLFTLGILAARTGGAGLWRGGVRVAFWGAFAMLVTAGIGHLFGVNV